MQDTNAMVGIVMGSDSDLPVMSEAAGILERLGIAYEITIVSAHRTPHRLYVFRNTYTLKRNRKDGGQERRLFFIPFLKHFPDYTESLRKLCTAPSQT